MTQSKELNLADYWKVVWRRRRAVAALFVIGTISIAVASLFMPSVYRASAVITPVASHEGGSGGGLSILTQRLGGLPGISMPDSGSSEITSLLNSNILREKVLAHDKTLRMLFPERWDEAAGTWKGGERSAGSLNPLALARSLMAPGPSVAGTGPPGPAASNAPTVWEGIRKLKEMVTITPSARDSTITITADAPTPEAAALTVANILDTLNEHMSAEAQRVARINRRYLEEQLTAAKDPIIRQKIYNM
ncbi:MAG: Wzz/FepE/Etk N-terminal domain-containing protein, partial [Thermodesulfobacteriota bacterium]